MKKIHKEEVGSTGGILILWDKIVWRGELVGVELNVSLGGSPESLLILAGISMQYLQIAIERAGMGYGKN